MYAKFLDYFAYALVEGDNADFDVTTGCPDTCNMLSNEDSMCCAGVTLYHPHSDTKSFMF